MWGNIAIAFLLAFIVSFVATPYTIKIANKIGAVDVPKDKRRMHTKAMPKFGGPAVILGVLVSMIYLIAVMSIEGSLDLFSTQQYGKKLLGVLLGVIVIAITGTLDDIKTVGLSVGEREVRLVVLPDHGELLPESASEAACGVNVAPRDGHGFGLRHGGAHRISVASVPSFQILAVRAPFTSSLPAT